MPGNANVHNAFLKVIRYYSRVMYTFGDTQPFVQTPQPIETNVVQGNKIHTPNIGNTAISGMNYEPITAKQSVGTSAKKEIVKQESPNATKLKIAKTVAINIDIENAVKNTETLVQLEEYVSQSAICDIKKFATKTVFGDGNPNAKILIIGEAPGQEEDILGIPFCGRSGELLMNALACIKLERAKNIYITNNIFWRPPGNRKPTDEELAACKPILNRIISIINPEIIICVGSVAVQNILHTQEVISSLRGRVLLSPQYKQKIFAVYHPSYLLRNPSKKYEMYKDLLFISLHISNLL